MSRDFHFLPHRNTARLPCTVFAPPAAPIPRGLFKVNTLGRHEVLEFVSVARVSGVVQVQTQKPFNIAFTKTSNYTRAESLPAGDQEKLLAVFVRGPGPVPKR